MIAADSTNNSRCHCHIFDERPYPVSTTMVRRYECRWCLPAIWDSSKKNSSSSSMMLVVVLIVVRSRLLIDDDEWRSVVVVR